MRLLNGWALALCAAVGLSNVALANDGAVMAKADMGGLIRAARTATLAGIEEWVGVVETQFAAELAKASALKASEAAKAAKAAKFDETRAIVYDAGWLAGLPVAKGDAQWECLTEALYFESRGEEVQGQFAVAEVILNRADSPLYPKTICGVVHQGGRGGCQFSFSCDRASDKMHEKAAYVQAGKIAWLMLNGAPRVLTEGATHFHTRNVRPGWAKRFTETAEIGAHVFYRQPGA